MNPIRSITHPARLIHDFAQEVDGFLIRRTSLGPRGEICALAVNEDPSPDLEMSFDVDTKTAYTYKIIRQSEHALQSWELKARYGHFYFYQPIGPDFALLVCARSQRYSQDRYDLNAKVFDTTGTLIREFLLGDGIQDLKVTDTSSIWTSYFDEGIAGNFGWERNDPVGAPGVILWDQYGSQQYAYPQTVEHLIDDCYAMNVVSDSEVWFYFYTDFDLAHFTNGQIEYMPIPVDGADGFVVYRDYFLFRGGYEDQNQYRLFQKQKGGHVQLITEVEFVDNHGNPLTPNWVDCRGDELLMQQKTASYVVNLRDVLYDM